MIERTNLLTFLKEFYARPTDVYKAKDHSYGQVFLALLFLFLLLLTPAVVRTLSYYHSQQATIADIQEKVPPFEIREGQMQMAGNRDSFLYQTDDFLFVFDPHGDIDKPSISDNVEKLDLIGAGGFLEDQLYITTPVSQASLPYQRLEGLTQDILSDRFFQQFIGLLLLVTAFVLFISFLFMTVFTSLFAKLVAIVNRQAYSFGQLWKMVIAASIWPVSIYAIFALLNVFSFPVYMILRILPLVLTSYSITKVTQQP